MRCIICHGDNIKAKDVREGITLGNDVVYISVQVPVCQNCGERYYDRRTLQFLEEIEEKIKKQKVKLKEVGKILMYEDASHVA